MTPPTIASPPEVLIPLSGQAVGTLQAMGRLVGGCEVRPSPFCHETGDKRRELRGWVLDTPGDASATALTVPHNLFHGVAVAMCELTDSDGLGLMQNAADTRQRLARAVERLMGRVTPEGRATWKRCRPAVNGVPTSLHSAVRDREGGIAFVADAGPIIDSEAWVPELSPDGFVGLYFRWHRGLMRLGRSESRLCMYVVCQSYLPLACAEFCDMVHRVEDGCTAGYVSLSEEAQWLRTACGRNRARIIAEVCADMGLRVPTVTDYCGGGGRAQQRPMALVATETLHHDLRFVRTKPTMTPTTTSTPTAGSQQGVVRVLNYCAETSSAVNGAVCTMAPWDSVWIFRGCAAEEGGDLFGGQPRGRHRQMVLPTTTPCVRERVRALTFTTAGRWCECSEVLKLWADPDMPHACFSTQEEASIHALNEAIENTLRQAAAAAAAQGSVFSTLAHTNTNEEEEQEDVDVLAGYQRALALQNHYYYHSPQQQEEDAAVAAAAAGRQRVRRCDHAEEEGAVLSQGHHLVFDEAVLQRMGELGWARSQGAAKLLPLGVALFEHWRQSCGHTSSSSTSTTTTTTTTTTAAAAAAAAAARKY
jgi:hypothetical protein